MWHIIYQLYFNKAIKIYQFPHLIKYFLNILHNKLPYVYHNLNNYSPSYLKYWFKVLFYIFNRMNKIYKGDCFSYLENLAVVLQQTQKK